MRDDDECGQELIFNTYTNTYTNLNIYTEI